MLISCLSPMPRAIEMMVSVVKNHADEELSSVLMGTIYNETIELVKAKYPLLSEVELTLPYADALLFGTRHLIDDAMMKLIRVGLFTNSIKNVAKGAYLIPQTSIVALGQLSSTYPYVDVLKTTIGLLKENMIQLQGEDSAGKALEIVAEGLVNARLQVKLDQAIAKEESILFPLRMLLMISFVDVDAIRNRKVALKQKLYYDCIMMKGVATLTRALPLSYKNGT